MIRGALFSTPYQIQTGATTASQHQKLVDANGIGCHNELQRPVSTEAVFNLLVWQPDCGDGERDGAKGA